MFWYIYKKNDKVNIFWDYNLCIIFRDLSTIDKDSSLSPTPGNRGEKLLNKIRSRVKLEKKESLK